MQHEPHQYNDQAGNGYCFVCGLKKSHTEASHFVLKPAQAPEPTDSEGDTATVWLARQFEFEYCHECGKDADKHTAVMVLGNWFARCDEPEPVKVYECGICDHVHPWEFDGDCREDANRYAGYEDYAERHNMSSRAVMVLTWEDRQEADNGEAQQTTD